MKKHASLILGLIQFFVAIGAVPAGYSMIVEPSGSDLGMTTAILEGSPFSSFLIPGIFLFTVNGIFNIIAAVLSFRKYRYAGLAGLFLGFALLIWISVQVYSVGLNHFLQPSYFIIGLFEIFISIILIRKNKI